jgi:2-succinyl-6-hydroxy-2,4-cyclohexadiene-1-carboxylate synthase
MTADRLHYHVQGPEDAPAILFLHGFLGTSADWDGLVSVLARRYRCITVDLPGHGASANVSAELFTMDGAAQALTDVLDAEGIDRAAVVGYSMGGRLALYFALHHAVRCRALVLESASPGLPTEAERAARRAADETRARQLETTPFDDFLRGWYAQPLFASLYHQAGRVERLLEARRHASPQALAQALCGLGTGQQPSLWAHLPGLALPALALAGALDAKYAALAEAMAAQAPPMQAALIPDAGHNVHLEQPDAWLAHVCAFLHQHLARATDC